MLVLQVLLCALMAYLLFCFLPAVTMFCSAFLGNQAKPSKKTQPLREYYRPFAAVLAEAEQTLEALKAEELTITAQDGTLLRGELLNGGFDKTVILLHGYRATPAVNCTYPAAAFYQRGYNVLLVYQRAHGKSGGSFTTMGLWEQYDVLRWIARAAGEPGVSRIVVYGISMGATAVALASSRITEPKVCSLVLDCGFTSIYGQLRELCKKWRVPFWAITPTLRLLCRWRFGASITTPVTESLEKNRIPAIFLHGTRDDVVPFSQGEQNYRACGAVKAAIFLPAAHTCTLLQGGEAALEQLFAFLELHSIKQE